MMMTETKVDVLVRKISYRIMPAVLILGGLGAVSVIAQDANSGAADQAAPAADSGQRTDGQIEMDVVHSLDSIADLKQDWITAGTVQGEVTLSGTSATEANRQLAESIAGKVPGVTKVVNNLKVGNPQQAENSASAAVPQDQGPQDQGSDMGQAGAPGAQTGQTGQPGQSGQSGQAQPQMASNAQAGPPPANSDGPVYPRPTYRPAPGRPLPPRMAEAPLAPVTIEPGELLKVRTSEPVDSKRAVDGTPVEFTVVRDVYAAGVLAIPRGATIRGHVLDAKKAGVLGGRAKLALKLETLELGGNSYTLDTDAFSVESPNKAGRTATNAFGGALLGALIGGAVGGGEGAAIGAGAGAAGGTAASAATPGPRVWIPSEALIDFHLKSPVTVAPVSAQEAQRLATNAPAPRTDRPTLYRRGGYYGYPPPPPPPGYYGPY